VGAGAAGGEIDRPCKRVSPGPGSPMGSDHSELSHGGCGSGGQVFCPVPHPGGFDAISAADVVRPPRRRDDSGPGVPPRQRMEPLPGVPLPLLLPFATALAAAAAGNISVPIPVQHRSHLHDAGDDSHRSLQLHGRRRAPRRLRPGGPGQMLHAAARRRRHVRRRREGLRRDPPIKPKKKSAIRCKFTTKHGENHLLIMKSPQRCRRWERADHGGSLYIGRRGGGRPHGRKTTSATVELPIEDTGLRNRLRAI
ncbi:Os07g0519450, partial [Oryza sativa Japonica Group]